MLGQHERRAVGGFFCRGRRARGFINRHEDAGPFAKNVGGIIEAFGEISPQRLPEEIGETFAQLRGEQFADNLDLTLGERSFRSAISPFGQDTRGHLMQRHGGRKQLGTGVPALYFSFGEKWIEIRRCADPDVLRGGSGEGKIKEAQLFALLGPANANPDVFGLDVAVGDAALVEVLDRPQQILAELLKHGQVKRALLAELLGEGDVACAFHGETDQVTKFVEVGCTDDLRPAQALQQLKFLADSTVQIGGTSHFEDALLALAFHQKCEGCRSFAQRTHDRETVFQSAAFGCVQRVDGFDLGPGQLILDVIESAEEVADVVAESDVRVGAQLDEIAKRLHGTVERFLDVESARTSKLFLEFSLRSGRWFPREQQVSKSAK